MNKIMFYCPSCKSFFNGERGEEKDVRRCKDCSSVLEDINIEKDDWDMKTSEEKDAIKEKLSNVYVNARRDSSIKKYSSYLGIGIMFFGFIGSLILSKEFGIYGDINIGVLIFGIISSISFGMLYLGLAEIISILEAIHNKK